MLKITESMRSKIPPCPGNRAPESFKSDLRFMEDSYKSPTWPVKPIIIPTAVEWIVDMLAMFILDTTKANNTDATIEHNMAPIAPSHVLEGLTCWKNGVLPVNFPIK